MVMQQYAEYRGTETKSNSHIRIFAFQNKCQQKNQLTK